jgi:hypothetical protein
MTSGILRCNDTVPKHRFTFVLYDEYRRMKEKLMVNNKNPTKSYVLFNDTNGNVKIQWLFHIDTVAQPSQLSHRSKGGCGEQSLSLQPTRSTGAY